MRNIHQLVEDFFDRTQVSVLVFGPTLEHEAKEDFDRALQDKRREIRSVLEELGHHVRYGEEEVDPNLPPPADNPVFQETLLMREYDLIVILLKSPGSIIEMGIVSTKAELARKAHVFRYEGHRGGLPWRACDQAQRLGAEIANFTFPADLVECHLLTLVLEKVRHVQVAKALS